MNRPQNPDLPEQPDGRHARPGTPEDAYRPGPADGRQTPPGEPDGRHARPGPGAADTQRIPAADGGGTRPPEAPEGYGSPTPPPIAAHSQPHPRETAHVELGDPESEQTLTEEAAQAEAPREPGTPGVDNEYPVDEPVEQTTQSLRPSFTWPLVREIITVSRSTLVLVGVFLVLFVLYLWVRDDPMLQVRTPAETTETEAPADPTPAETEAPADDTPTGQDDTGATVPDQQGGQTDQQGGQNDTQTGQQPVEPQQPSPDAPAPAPNGGEGAANDQGGGQAMPAPGDQSPPADEGAGGDTGGDTTPST